MSDQQGQVVSEPQDTAALAREFHAAFSEAVPGYAEAAPHLEALAAMAAGNGAFLAAVKALLARLAANPQALAGFLGLIGSLVSALSGGQAVTSSGPVPAQDVSGVVTAEPS